MSASNEKSSSENSYFDLHVTGTGYVNRIREVKPTQGQRFLACTIGALRGHKDNVAYTYFDCRVTGAAAQHLIRRCEDAARNNKKVLIGFRLGDVYTETFVYSKGEKKGQTGVSLKARLLYIGWIKVDGADVYKAPKSIDADPIQSDAPTDAKATDEPASDAAPEAHEATAETSF